MAWMSINRFKKRYGFGKVGTPPKSRGKRDEELVYEKFHEVSADGKTLTLEMKKQYMRIMLDPLDSVVPLDAAAAAAMMKAILKRIEKPDPKNWHGRAARKDETGLKVYGQFNEVDDMPVVVKAVDQDRVAILVPSRGFPHLREVEALELVRCLGRFVHEKKLAGKTCKECAKLGA